MVDHKHTPDNADRCFGCKMAYVRQSGGLAVSVPSLGNGRTWFDSTIKIEQDRIKAEAKANGWEARQKHPVYDRMPARAAR